MQWFKHQSDARNSLKLRKVRRKYGADGYAIYWFCLEAIAYEVNKDNLTFDLKEDAETIGFELSIQEKRVEEIMKYMIEVGLFESSGNVITCLKLAESIDKSMTNSPKMRQWLDAKTIKNASKNVMTHDDIANTCAELEVEVEVEVEKKKKKNIKNTMSGKPDDVQKIFDYWKSRMGKSGNSKLTKDRRAKIKSRLSEGYTPQQICQAIDGCASSTYHMGQNDQGTVYDDLTLICRNGSKLEWFINNIGKISGAQRGQNQFAGGQKLSAVERSREAINANRIARGEAPLGGAEPCREVVGENGGYVRVHVPETIREHAEQHMGEVLDGDYGPSDGGGP